MSEDADDESSLRFVSDVRLQFAEYPDPPILESLNMELSSFPLCWREMFRAELVAENEPRGEAKSSSVGRFAATSARVVRQPGLCNPISVMPFFKTNDGCR